MKTPLKKELPLKNNTIRIHLLVILILISININIMNNTLIIAVIILIFMLAIQRRGMYWYYWRKDANKMPAYEEPFHPIATACTTRYKMNMQPSIQQHYSQYVFDNDDNDKLAIEKKAIITPLDNVQAIQTMWHTVKSQDDSDIYGRITTASEIVAPA